MLDLIREFRVGRPQIFAGLLLLVFLAQCLWVSASRRFSDLEYQYIASGFRSKPGMEFRVTSPFTGIVAAFPLRVISAVRGILPARIKAALAVPHPWLARLPFVIFGMWLGGAIWWVARRLFGDGGGYVALALYCFSPAMVMISSNIGPEIILAWSGFGLIYTAIGAAHTVYAPPRKWIPRIVILGIAIGICLSTTFWAFTMVLLAFAFMLYLAPGRRQHVLIVLAGSVLIGLGIFGIAFWLTGSMGLGSWDMVTPRPTRELVRNLGFVFADGRVLAALFVAALIVYGSWPRSRYFGNTAPLITSFTTVLLFALVPAIYLWDATLALSFAFTFIGGIAADLLERPSRLLAGWVLAAIIAIRAVLGLSLLNGWVHQNLL